MAQAVGTHRTTVGDDHGPELEPTLDVFTCASHFQVCCLVSWNYYIFMLK